jgi:4-hydroxy-2-oxovalerate aldolase
MGNGASNGPVRLVETTLRDGSYAVDFQFTAADTAFIVSSLAAAGVTYIELCHGAGFRNASSPYKSKTRPAATDEEHLAAAQSAARNAQLGVITGAWAKHEMNLLTRHGFKFVRIGLLPHELELEESLATIDAAKEAGLTVSLNLMQTQMIPIAEVARIAGVYQKRGVDWLYVVDSAGGMMPQVARDYVRAVREASDLVIGLHAHHNTGMALAICVAAIEAGATRVDSTLQGIGRGAGNPPTEQLLLLLQSLGHEREIAIDPVLRLGDLARPLFEDKGQDPTFFASGIAQIHSGNVPVLLKHATENGRSQRAFLIEVGRNEKKLVAVGVKSLPPDISGPATERTPPAWHPEPADAAIHALADQFLRASGPDLAAACEAMFVNGLKAHKPTVLQLAPSDQLWFDGAVAWESESWIGVTAPLPAGGFTLRERGPAVLMIDPSLGQVDVAAGQVIRHGFHRVLADAITDTVDAALAMDAGSVSLEVTGPLRDILRGRLAELGTNLSDARAARVRIVDAAAGDWAATASAGSTIILLAPHSGDAVTRARAAGARVIRPNLGRAVAGRVTALAGLANRLRAPSTAEESALHVVDVTHAAGADDVVVDDVQFPSHLVSAGTHDRAAAATAVARLRLKAMLAGRGRL